VGSFSSISLKKSRSLLGHDAPGFRFRVENEKLYTLPCENAATNCRLKNYPVLDTVGRTFQAYQEVGFPIEASGNDRLLEYEVKDLAQLIEKGTLPWLKKITPFG
jgi:hypothetical protein